MRRPNGTGTITKLTGNRRKPYLVRVPARDEHNFVVQKVLSYHATSKEAQLALDEYNRNNLAGISLNPDKLSTTMQQVYDLWSARKYAKAGTASISSYKASWARLAPLSGLKMRDVSTDRLQSIIDTGEAAGLSHSSLNNDKVLAKALFRFSMERDIIGKDYSEYVKVPSVDAKFEKGAFSDLQIKKLENLVDDGFPWADTVLMLCYTGFRITEFLILTQFSYNAQNDCLMGGLKTDAGKNRIVPIHPKIKPHLMRWLSKGANTIICREDGTPMTSRYYRNFIFQKVAEALDEPQATPHWCRHTFATRLHAAGVPELEQKRLMGHSNKDITAHYTHTDFEQLTAAIRRLA